MTDVIIVGGASIDIQGFSRNKLIYRDSNIGSLNISLGGVGRNIGENLVKLGVSTKLISVIGDDIYGKEIFDEANSTGLDMKNSLILKGKDTSTYLSITDERGDMALAISSMDIYDNMNVEFIEKKRDIIEDAKICIVDTNIPKEVIEYMVFNFKNVKFFLDTVSTAKTAKVKDIIGSFNTIKPNKLEVEILTGIKILSNDDLVKSANYLHDKGVNRVFITLGKDGVFYSDGAIRGRIESPNFEIINATGAGDAFVAALAYGYLNNIDIEETARIGMAASVIALSHKNTINPNMSIEKIKFIMEEIVRC